MLLSRRPVGRKREKGFARPRPTRPRVRSNLSRPQVEQLEDRCLMSADPILEWNAVAIESDRVDHSRPPGSPQDQGGPTRSARAMAITHAAMFDAYNSINPRYTPYLTFIPVNRPASTDAAVAQAARDTLVTLYPQQQARFNEALAETLERVPDGEAELRGRVIGRLVAQRILEDRADDGSNADMPYTPENRPGFHNVDPLHPTQGFLTPRWGRVEPFTLNSGSQFRARALDDGSVAGRAQFLRSAEYTAAYNEVRVQGAVDAETADRDNNGRPDRTPAQTVIGIYWGYDGSPGLGTPPRLYNQITRVIAEQEDNTVAENARLFALVNLAMGDAGIASWETKYHFDFWRPILGIRGGGNDGNPQTRGETTWAPLGAPASNPFPGQTNFTPPFPAYTSGHATFGGALFQTLTRFYGTSNISFTFVSDEFNGVTRDQSGAVRPRLPATFDTLREAEAENAQSRIYLGIHWRFDADEGVRQGNRVANFVFNNFLRPWNDTPTTTDAPDPADPTLVDGLLDEGPATTGTSGDSLAAPLPAPSSPTGTDPSSDTSVGSTPTSPSTGGTTGGTETADATDLLFQFPELFADDIV